MVNISLLAEDMQIVYYHILSDKIQKKATKNILYRDYGISTFLYTKKKKKNQNKCITG